MKSCGYYYGKHTICAAVCKSVSSHRNYEQRRAPGKPTENGKADTSRLRRRGG